VQGKGDDSVVKRRPVIPADLPEELRRSPSFVVEVDAARGLTPPRSPTTDAEAAEPGQSRFARSR
jgi:hypothetical protein